MKKYNVSVELKGAFAATINAESPQDAEAKASAMFMNASKSVLRQDNRDAKGTLRMDPVEPFSAKAAESVNLPKIDWAGVKNMLTIIEGEFSAHPEERHVLAVLTAAVKTVATYVEDPLFQRLLAQSLVEQQNRTD